MLQAQNYTGLTRFVVYCASLVAMWPHVLWERHVKGYGFRGLYLRLCQEWGILCGVPETVVKGWRP